ncbi:MAG: hypothetical protein U0271_11550 [Polyangiaceae bacterium]
MKITKVTPILSVENIEACLPFWIEKLGYEKTMEMPHDGRLGFVILVKDGIELMLQTHASVRDDLPAIAEHFRPGSTCLYADVDSIEEAAASLAGVEIIVPLRETPYGARELWVRTEEGHILGLAEFAKRE